MNKFFDLITGLINGVEDSLINLVSVIVPWLVPIIPAYLTYMHTNSTGVLKFPDWVAVTAAIVVEFLGLASMRTSIKFYEHNRRYKTEYKQAPFFLTLSTYVFYIIVILVVNVMLEWGEVSTTHIIAIGLFSLLSVPAGVLISVRAQHTELEREILRDKERAAVTRAQNRQPVIEKKDTRSEPASAHSQEILELLEAIYANENRIAGPTELANAVKLDATTAKGYISTLTKRWREQRGLIQ